MRHDPGRPAGAEDADGGGAPSPAEARPSRPDDAERTPSTGAEPDYDDPVDEAGEESFPASDPPSFNP